MIRLFLAVVIAALVAQSAPTPLLDITNVPVHDRLRQPVTASGSGHQVTSEAGLESLVPISLRLVSLNKSGNPGAVTAEVELRNVSHRDLEIPVDPSSRDVEPVSPLSSYRYLTAYVWLALDTETEQRIASRGLHLYGSRQIPETLRILKSGEALRIRANLPLPPSLHNVTVSDQSGAPAFKIRAFLALFDESITPEADGLHSNKEEMFPTVTSTTAVDFH
jgi:hypothetical protein